MTKKNNIKQKVQNTKPNVTKPTVINNGVSDELCPETRNKVGNSTKQERKNQTLLSCRALCFYVAIFLCMLLFESQRFGLYFERKSTEIPEFAQEFTFIGYNIENIAIFSGISASSEMARRTFNALSNEYPLQTNESFFEKYAEYLQIQASFFTPSYLQSLEFLAARQHQLNTLAEKNNFNANTQDFSFTQDASLQDRVYAFLEKEVGFYTHELTLLANTVMEYPFSWFETVKLALNLEIKEEKEEKEENTNKHIHDEIQAAYEQNHLVAQKQGDELRENSKNLAPSEFVADTADTIDTFVAEQVQAEQVQVEQVQAEQVQITHITTDQTPSIKEYAEKSLNEASKESPNESLFAITETSTDFGQNHQSATSIQEHKDFVPEKALEIAHTGSLYDQSHSTPAPTEWALPEYATVLPDFGKKQRVLLIGDSMMMEGLGPSLQALLRKRPDLEVTRLGRYSSGLSRPDFYDWPESLARLEEKHNPDLVIISLGANDTQDIVIDKKRYFIDTEPWEEVYRERTYDLLYAATLSDKEDTLKNPREVVWVSLPVMYFEKYAARTRLISQIQEEVVSHFDNAQFINIEHLLTNEQGEYINFVKDSDTAQSIRLRREDNIHVTDAGGHILAEYVAPFIEERLKALRIASVTNNSSSASQNSLNLSQRNNQNIADNHASKKIEQGTSVFEVANAFAMENEDHVSEVIEEQATKRISILAPVAGQANRVLFTSEARNKQVEYYIYLPEPLNSIATKDSKDVKTESVHKVPYVYDVLTLKEINREDTPEDTPEDMPEERFPVLYLLQGAYAENVKFWNEFIGKELQKIANEERVIIVAPFCEPFGWYVNAPTEINVSEGTSVANKNAYSQIETFIVKELVPHIDALYPTNKKRALAGNSMGGHGALLLGFKYPNLFSSVASLSGVLDIRLHANQWHIKDVLGEMHYNPKNWEENSVTALIGEKWQRYAPKQILIFTGTEDFYVLEDNRKARDLLLKRQYDFDYGEASGEHDWIFWSEHFPIQLRKQAVFLHAL